MAYFNKLVRGKLVPTNICEGEKSFDSNTPREIPANVYSKRALVAKFDTDAFCKECCDLDKAKAVDLFVGLAEVSAGILRNVQTHIYGISPGFIFDLEVISLSALEANPNATGTVLKAGIDASSVSHTFTDIAAADGFIDMYGLTDASGDKSMDVKVVGIRIKALPTAPTSPSCSAAPVVCDAKLCFQFDYDPFNCGKFGTNGEKGDPARPYAGVEDEPSL